MLDARCVSDVGAAGDRGDVSLPSAGRLPSPSTGQWLVGGGGQYRSFEKGEERAGDDPCGPRNACDSQW